jgi:hypothetical protein
LSFVEVVEDLYDPTGHPSGVNRCVVFGRARKELRTAQEMFTATGADRFSR